MGGVVTLPLEEAPADLVQLHAMWLSTSINPALERIIPLLGQ